MPCFHSLKDIFRDKVHPIDGSIVISDVAKILVRFPLERESRKHLIYQLVQVNTRTLFDRKRQIKSADCNFLKMDPPLSGEVAHIQERYRNPYKAVLKHYLPSGPL